MPTTHSRSCSHSYSGTDTVIGIPTLQPVPDLHDLQATDDTVDVNAPLQQTVVAPCQAAPVQEGKPEL
jgi:hypothetical protein